MQTREGARRHDGPPDDMRIGRRRRRRRRQRRIERMGDRSGVGGEEGEKSVLGASAHSQAGRRQQHTPAARRGAQRAPAATAAAASRPVFAMRWCCGGSYSENGGGGGGSRGAPPTPLLTVAATSSSTAHDTFGPMQVKMLKTVSSSFFFFKFKNYSPGANFPESRAGVSICLGDRRSAIAGPRFTELWLSSQIEMEEFLPN